SVRVFSAIASATAASPGAPPPSLIFFTLEPGPMGSTWRPIAAGVPCPGSRQTSGIGGWASTERSLPVSDPLLAFDKAVGDGVERLVRSHHRRRLRRLGWERALDPPDDGLWAAGAPGPRGGNAIEVLVDGAEALPRIVTELRRARSPVHTAGRYLSRC